MQGIEQFYTFVFKRQEIWHKRFILKKSYPWTKDLILQRYKFCNVYRELDKGTQILIESLSGYRKEDIILNVILYRFFNVRNFFKVVGNNLQVVNFDRLKLERVLDLAKDRGEKLFRDAYQTGNKNYNIDYRLGEKHVQLTFLAEEIVDRMDYLLDLFLSDNWNLVLNGLISFDNIGNFMAYQILLDLSYFKIYSWTDNDIVVVGPGAVGGLEAIFKNSRVKDIYLLRDLQEKRFNSLGLPFKDIAYKKAFSNFPYLSLSNIEHSLCEFRKYINLKAGKGRRRLYKYKGVEKV